MVYCMEGYAAGLRGSHSFSPCGAYYGEGRQLGMLIPTMINFPEYMSGSPKVFCIWSIDGCAFAQPERRATGTSIVIVCSVEQVCMSPCKENI